MMRFSATRRRRTASGMTPLVDVVFLMLVFFLLTSSFVRYRAVEVDFTETREGASADRTQVVLRLDKGNLTIDGAPVNVNDVPRGIAERLADFPALGAIVLVDEGSPLQSLVTVVEAVREGGIEDIEIGNLEN